MDIFPRDFVSKCTGSGYLRTQSFSSFPRWFPDGDDRGGYFKDRGVPLCISRIVASGLLTFIERYSSMALPRCVYYTQTIMPLSHCTLPKAYKDGALSYCFLDRVLFDGALSLPVSLFMIGCFI
uniref:Uncharacterized protein n=1 Tax=Steinernema glaseri TaxID=37863 RepID=A0A1I7ZAB9_9BILA